MLALLYYHSKRKDDSGQYYSNLLSRKPNVSKDLSRKCRVCLQEGNYSIFGEESIEETTEALQTFGNIFVSEEDGYTTLLCNTCYKFIKQAIAFRKVAMQSEELLKKPREEESDHEFHNDPINFTYAIKECGNKSNNTELENSGHKDHDYIKPENLKVACKICSKVMYRKHLKVHMTLHDPNHIGYVCDICGKSFRLRCTYYNHRLRHNTNFSFKCQLCPYKAKYGELLKSHMRTHSGDCRYKCTECPAKFSYKSNLNRHMLRHKMPLFICDECKRVFHTKLMLQNHYRCDHLGIKDHVCNICGKSFGCRNAMMKHQRRVHKREKISLGRMPAYLLAEKTHTG